MTNIFLLHGFNVRDGGKKTIGRLSEVLPSARLVSYGFLGLIGVRFFNDNLAKMLASLATPDCVLIGHSNAASIIYEALQLEQCPKIKRIVLIRPALDSNVDFGSKVERVDVFHHEGDKPVFLSQFLPCHSWGDMGTEGYDGPNDFVFNHNSEEIFGIPDHSAFAGAGFAHFSGYLKRLLTETEPVL